MTPIIVRMSAAALLLLAACSRGEANGSPPPSGLPAAADTTHPYPDTTEASAILKRLKTLAPTGGSGFDTAYAPRIDTSAVLAFVSDSGLVMSDVNDDSGSVRLSRHEIASQLAERRGRAFTTLVHLAHIYSQPYPQYSKLTFARRPGELEVAVATWYRLGFVREYGHVRLRRVDYTEFEEQEEFGREPPPDSSWPAAWAPTSPPPASWAAAPSSRSRSRRPRRDTVAAAPNSSTSGCRVGMS